MIPQLIQARLDAAGTADARGRRLQLADRHAGTVVGRVCDDEPLLRTEVMLARLDPERVVRGLAAAALLCRADSAVLAVDEQAVDVLRSLGRAAHGSRVRLAPLPPRCPMDRASLICDLSEEAGRSGVAAAAGLEDAVVLDVVTLCDIATALEARPALRRAVSVEGCVCDPAVVRAPLGTSLEDLLAACGGSPDPAPVCYHNGLLGGRRVLTSHTVDLDTRGVVFLPHDHVAVQRESTPLADEVGRIRSACVGCRICTDTCSVHLGGGRLEPHLVMRMLAAARSTDREAAAALGALECSGCGVCSACCPSALGPARAIAAVAAELRVHGVGLAERGALRPHPDRAGRRQGMGRMLERLGLAAYARSSASEVRSVIRQVLPERLTLSLCSPTGTSRVAAVRPGQRVGVGDIVALAPAGCGEPDVRSPVGGVVEAVDLDDGVTLQVR